MKQNQKLTKDTKQSKYPCRTCRHLSLEQKAKDYPIRFYIAVEINIACEVQRDANNLIMSE